MHVQDSITASAHVADTLRLKQEADLPETDVKLAATIDMWTCCVHHIALVTTGSHHPYLLFFLLSLQVEL
jgi:hypothetical protein